MERLRITELLADHAARNGGVAVSKTELAEAILGADKGRPQGGKSRPLSESRKRSIVWHWDYGKGLTSLKPRHVLRLARFFGIKRIEDLFEE